MKITWKWLKEYVDLTWTPQEFIDRMMMLGLEVESSESVGGDLEKIIVGRILKIEPHPEAEHLVVCQVDAGQERDLNIVCGAKNMKAGDKVPVATHGVELPGGLVIKKSKLRGVVSEGMLCSDRELGLADDHSGIKILPEDSAVGDALTKAIGLDDHIMEIKVTANRPDYLSLVGIARDVAAAANLTVKTPVFRIQEGGAPTSSVSSVKIEDPDLCPRYVARVIEGVKIGPSPDWLKTRLERSGMRSINNVVDATNYVLLELGHPMHAFDMDKLGEKRIVVRRAKPGETIRTIDGQQRNLTPEMLVIADAQIPVALAGIMGGGDSEVSDDTVNVLLESAYFDPVCIRRTSRQLGISTEASYRFERGADYQALLNAANRCAAMIQELAGGTVLQGAIDIEPPQDDPKRYRWPKAITLRKDRVKAILGVEIPENQIVGILTSLGLTVQPDGDLQWTVLTPAFRVDLFREIDLIEEIARLYGYDKIVSSYPLLRVEPLPTDTPYRLQEKAVDLLVSAGLQEVITYSFMGEQDLDVLKIPEASPLRDALRLSNPLSQEESLIRTTLVPRLLGVYDYNQRRGRRDLAIFEIADCYRNGAKDVEESAKAGILLAGEPPPHWSVATRPRDFFDAKGLTTLLLNTFRAERIRQEKSSFTFLEPGKGIDLYFGDRLLGFYGELSQEIANKLDFLSRIALVEIDLDVLHRAVGPDQRKLTTPSPYPAMERDIAIIVSLDVSSEKILEAIRRTGKAMLESVVLFDRYRGKQVAGDRCSLAFRLVYRAADRTLTDEEVNTRHDKVLKTLEREFQASLRV